MQKNRGFTVVEITTAFIIIAILLGAMLSMLGRYMAQAREDARQAKFVEVQDMVNKEFLKLQMISSMNLCHADYTEALQKVAQNGKSQAVGPGYEYQLTVTTALVNYRSYDDHDGLTGVSSSRGSRYRTQAVAINLLINGKPVNGRLLLPDQFCNSF